MQRLPADRAIEQVKPDLGKSYPLVIGGREVHAASQFDEAIDRLAAFFEVGV